MSYASRDQTFNYVSLHYCSTEGIKSDASKIARHTFVRTAVITSLLVVVKSVWAFFIDHHLMEVVVADVHTNMKVRDVGDNPLPKIRNQEIQGRQREIICL